MTRHDLRLLYHAVAVAASLGAALCTVHAVLFGDPDAGV